jgi:ectoine hydroxylase-related dioxygenase (phytanoyl-CoA dioxygenase family)
LVPRRLTTEERRVYDEQGFVVVPNILPAAELHAINQEVDRILPRNGSTQAHLPGCIMQLGLHSALVRRLVADERLLGLVEDVVQPGIAVLQAMVFSKPPHYDLVCHWHQDDAFYAAANDAGTHSRTRLSVWTPLQDVDERNSCLWVVPGSHKWGLQPFEIIHYDQCRRRLSPEQFDFSRALPVPMRAGSALLFSALTWHHSKGNESDSVRRALIVTYEEATVRGRSAPGEWRILRPAA